MTSLPEAIARAVHRAVEPLHRSLQDPGGVEILLRRYGWQCRANASIATALEAAFDIAALLDLLNRLETLLHSGNRSPGTIAQFADSATTLIEKITTVRQRANNLSIAPFNAAGFWQAFPLDLLADLLAERLRYDAPLLYAPLLLTGIIRYARFEPSSGDPPERLRYERTVLDWKSLPALFGNPAGHLSELYGWRTSLEYTRLLDVLGRAALGLGIPARQEPVSPALRAYFDADAAAAQAGRELALPLFEEPAADGSGYIEVGLLVLPVPRARQNVPPSGLAISALARGYEAQGIPITRNLSLVLSGGFDASGAVSVAFWPDLAELKTALPTVNASAVLAGSPSTPWVIVGDPESHHVEIAALSAAIRVKGSVADPEIVLDLDLGDGASKNGLAFAVQFGDGDSFLQALFGTAPQRLAVSVGAEWSSKRGLSFKGAGALELTIPVHRQVGPVDLQSVSVWLRGANGDGEMGVATSGSITIGPITVAVDRVGLKLLLHPVADGQRTGVFGALDATFGYKPPDGVGLVIDASAVVGGGFLSFDPVKEEYTGAVQLALGGRISLSGFGLLTTRMPDGSKGFSLLILISATFSPPVQLGYGFTLDGVGGLLGVNRTVAEDVLRAGLRQGTLGSVLFPPLPIRNAPQIVSDLQAIFPPAEGRFLIGPLFLLGWGTPRVLTLELGLVLELPAPVRLIVLGRLRLLLPEEKRPTVRLQLDALGVINFATGDVALDAVLYDSNIAQFTVTGGMALRANWGASPTFVLALGGLNPRFHAPPGFPTLDRVAINLATGKAARLRLEAYLALTTSTLQFGANLDVHAEFGPFSIEGGLGFDALVQFAPFGFVADIAAAAALKFNGRSVVSIVLAMTLSGPTPWHAVGQGTFLWFGLRVTRSFEVQVGQDEPPPLPAPVDVRPLLLAALSDPSNWATQLPAREHAIVTFRDKPTAGGVLVHPLADIQVSQRVVPLGQGITRYGNTTPAGDRLFKLGVVYADGIVEKGVNVVTEDFARAQFWDLTDDDKLIGPTFERLQSGIRFTQQNFNCGPEVVDTDIVYDTETEFPSARSAAPTDDTAADITVTDDGIAVEQTQGWSTLSAAFVEQVAASGAAGLAPFTRDGPEKFQAPPQSFRLKAPVFVVATGLGHIAGALADFVPLDVPTATDVASGASTYTAAAEVLRHLLTQHPEQRATLRVVPYYPTATTTREGAVV